MTLAELSTAWNDLRNAALGRGTAPNVAPVLASEVGTAYDQWRAWYEHAGSLEDVFASVSAHAWLNRYRALAAKLRTGGIKFTELPLSSTEQIAAAATTGVGALLSGAARIALIGAAALGLSFGVVLALRGGGRR